MTDTPFARAQSYAADIADLARDAANFGISTSYPDGFGMRDLGNGDFACTMKMTRGEKTLVEDFLVKAGDPIPKFLGISPPIDYITKMTDEAVASLHRMNTPLDAAFISEAITMKLLRFLRAFTGFDASRKQHVLKEYAEYMIIRRAAGANAEEVSTGCKVFRGPNAQKAILVNGTDDQFRFFIGMKQISVTTNDLQFIEERRKAGEPRSQ